MKSSVFKNKTIVIGITGSIACYKALSLIKELRKLGARVHVIMTEHATHLVDKNDFEKASGNEVQTDLFDKNIDYKDYIKKNKPMKHISLADVADLFIICPATANVIGKIAHGITDDLLTTSVSATIAPILICPAMNVKMWQNPLIQRNVELLKNLSYHFVQPEYGDLACGYKGVGRLAKPEKILKRAELLLQKKTDLQGKKIIVTAGATIEEIDPVRVITNKSSGKMGVRIAEQAFLRGAEVLLLRSISSINPQYLLREMTFTTAKDLLEKIEKNIAEADIVIHVAAVSDFSINKNDRKIKSGQALSLELTPTTKILEKIKKLNSKIFLVGFKAEYQISQQQLIESAYKLLQSTRADLMVANDVGKAHTGFDVDTNEVYFVDKNMQIFHIGLSDKRVIADKLLDQLKI